MSGLLDAIAIVCQERGIDVEVDDDRRVHCLARLAAVTAPAAH
jgi:hypothetical protein